MPLTIHLMRTAGDGHECGNEEGGVILILEH